VIKPFHNLCLICTRPDVHGLRGYEQHDLLKCSVCGFVFMRKIPTSDELESYYSVYAYQQEKEIPPPTKISLEGLLDKFEKYRKNNRILDVGCGEGWILQLARGRGWQVYGTEFSSRAIAICSSKGIKMYSGVLNPRNIEEKEFDVIISSETIEHINNPKEEVLNIHTLLRTGGLFYVTTPNFDSYLRRIFRNKYDIIGYPEHLCYYTKKTLDYLLRQSGFCKVKLLTTGISISHYQFSRVADGTPAAANRNADERLRSRIAKSYVLRGMKKIINGGLSFLGIGMTLKAFYVKN
jgi:2-polyprenyl-3-methyl-5-hydroxy-6-metoxy-1,4-benzoquinol methylase